MANKELVELLHYMADFMPGHAQMGAHSRIDAYAEATQEPATDPVEPEPEPTAEPEPTPEDQPA